VEGDDSVIPNRRFSSRRQSFVSYLAGDGGRRAPWAPAVM
jgi:hypothetical protein